MAKRMGVSRSEVLRRMIELTFDGHISGIDLMEIGQSIEGSDEEG